MMSGCIYAAPSTRVILNITWYVIVVVVVLGDVSDNNVSRQ